MLFVTCQLSNCQVVVFISLWTVFQQLSKIRALPVFPDVSPVTGPLEGGTMLMITITGNDDIRPIEVGIGDLAIAVDTGPTSNGTILVRTPKADASIVSIPQPISVTFNDSQAYSTGFNFTYLPLPVVTSIYPKEYIYTGGIRLTVHGDGLDISVSPVLQVTTVSRLLLGGQWQQEIVVYQTGCTEITSTRLICKTPGLQLPDPIQSYMDSIDPVYDRTHDRINFIPDAVTSLLRRGYVDDGLGNRMSVYVGLLFDDNANYGNLSQSGLGVNGSMVLVPGPTMDFSTKQVDFVRADYADRDYIMEGDMVGLGASEEDYDVLLEGKPCVVNYISEEHSNLQFRMTETYQLPFVNESIEYPDFHCNQPDTPNLYHLQVLIGYRLHNVNCINAIQPCTPRPCQHGGTCNDLDLVYNCTCTKDFYGDNCQYDYPAVKEVKPTYGPALGGTSISITALVNTDRFKTLGIFVGDAFYPAGDNRHDMGPDQTHNLHVDGGNIIVRSPPGNINDTVMLIILFKWTYYINENASVELRQLNITADLTFSYRPNPIISGMYPLEHIYVGGTKFTVNGTNLDSVAAPLVNVSVAAKYQVTGGAPMSYSASFTSPCNNTQSDNSMMTCAFPVMEIPAELLPYLDTLNYTNMENISTYNCSSRYSTGSQLTTPTEVKFRVGFILDGCVEYADYAPIMVFPPPIICTNSTFQPNGIFITGRHLFRGVQRTDYVFDIGGVSLSTITVDNVKIVMTDKRIDIVIVDASFLPLQDDAGQRYDCTESFPLHITVTVAGHNYYPGCVGVNATRACYAGACDNAGTCYIEHKSLRKSCLCMAEYYGTSCTYVKPVLNITAPSSGILAGGTPITIAGTIADDLEPFAVHFGQPVNKNVTELEWTSKQISVATPDASSATGNNSELVIVVSVYYTHSASANISFEVGNYTYLSKPVIERMYPRDHMVKGGTTLSIEGQGLDVARSPVTLTIQIETWSLDPVNTIKNVRIQTFPTPNCTVDDAGQLMTCHMPSTQIPNEFFPLVDTLVGDPASLGTLRRRRRRDLSLVSESGARMTVYVWLQFDAYLVNVSDVEGLDDNATLLLHKPPVLHVPDTFMPFYPGYNELVEIWGVNITLGANAADDITVRVGNSVVQITNSSAQRLWVLPFDEPNNSTSIDEAGLNATDCVSGSVAVDPETNLSNVFLVEVSIGYATYRAGCIQYVYVDKPHDYRDELGTHVGAAVGGAALILIVIAIITRQRKPDVQT